MAYDVFRDADSPDRFVAHECWRDLAALQDRFSYPSFHCGWFGSGWVAGDGTVGSSTDIVRREVGR